MENLDKIQGFGVRLAVRMISLDGGTGFAVGWPTKSCLRKACTMWNWLNCYLSGRHEFGVWCEPGTIFLRCVHCGRRSPGWFIEAKPRTPHVAARAQSTIADNQAASRVLPFERVAAG